MNKIDPRYDDIVKMKSTGETYSQIGRFFRVSRQRVQQIIIHNTKLETHTHICSNCGKMDVPLQRHHTSYEKDEIVLLCIPCHRSVHPCGVHIGKEVAVMEFDPGLSTTERVYNCIAKSLESMTLADIARGCGLASRSVALYHVRKLAEANRIIFVSGRHRSIRMPDGVK